MVDTERISPDQPACKPCEQTTVPTRNAVIDCLRENIDMLQTFNLHSLFLFGSVARDEATSESDLDFLVEFEDSATLRRYMGLKCLLEELFERPIDLVTIGSLKSQISQSVLEDAIRVA